LSDTCDEDPESDLLSFLISLPSNFQFMAHTILQNVLRTAAPPGQSIEYVFGSGSWFVNFQRTNLDCRRRAKKTCLLLLPCRTVTMYHILVSDPYFYPTSSMLNVATGNIIGSLLSADVYSRYVSVLCCGPSDLKSTRYSRPYTLVIMDIC